MRAALCKAFSAIDPSDASAGHRAGDAPRPPQADVLSIEDVATPEPGPGQVRVTIRAAGVNFPDLLMVQGLYQFKPPFPFAPGGEVAGVVSAVGPGATTALGAEVIAFCGHGGF